MSAQKPLQSREPYCKHPGGEKQPASACRICKDAPWLREWRDQWTAWLAENPDSWEAREVARLVKSGYLERFPSDPPEWTDL